MSATAQSLANPAQVTDPSAAHPGHRPYPATLAAAVAAAAARIAPLWPLDAVVAVNPFLGLVEHSFVDAGRLVAQASGARLTMSRRYYLDALDAGLIDERDLQYAIDLLGDVAPVGLTPATLPALAGREDIDPTRLRRPTVASVAAARTGLDLERLVVEQMSSWAADYFDTGAAAWQASREGASAYDHWRRDLLADFGAVWHDLPHARQLAGRLPLTDEALITQATARLGIAADGLTDYFYRLLSDVAGWAGHARYRGWLNELAGTANSAAAQLLPIRLAWEWLIIDGLARDDVSAAWARERSAYASDDAEVWARQRAVDHVLQFAFERAATRRAVPAFNTTCEAQTAPLAQAVFCIDVRSERLRRAVETISPGVETLGFAGFFGVPLKLTRAGAPTTQARAPVLLDPPVHAHENATAPDATRAADQRSVAGRWARFRSAAVSSFGYVESAGPAYLAKLVRAALGRRPAEASVAQCHGHPAELDLDLEPGARVDLAEGLLRGMSLTEHFAPLVLLVGHGSSSTNNPFAAGLDCGACGGHAGDVNARAAVQLLNDSAVRAALAERGIRIPDDTAFVAALHDTTTDDVVLLEQAKVADLPGLTALIDTFKRAGREVRAERAPTLGASNAAPHRFFLRRSRDWAQTRPEWALAGCAAFIAAPRGRTRGLDLAGRSFLHSYDWRADKDFAVLETIMTAPLVVASWINLQYFGSTVDNRVFGSGNKTLHNVVSGIGVLEGRGGDLRVGLPLQSVHDGQQPMHEPVRLAAFIEAPCDAIESVLNRHCVVRDLVENNWIRLHCVADDGSVLAYSGDGRWQ